MKPLATLVLVSSLSLGATPDTTKTKKDTAPKARPLIGRLRPNLRVLKKPQRFLGKKRVRPADPPCLGMQALADRDGPRPFAIGEELGYELDVAGAYLGRFETKVGRPRKIDGRTMIPLFGRARTNDFVSAVQPFAGRYMTMVDPSTLRPAALRVELDYGGDDRWEKVKFGRSLQDVTVDYRLRGYERRREWKTDHLLTDLLSMLYAARTVRLAPGLDACQDVFGARRLWRMTAKVEGIVPVDTPAGKKDAYKVTTLFHRKPHHTLNNNKRPKAEIDVFFSTDGAQTPLMFVVRTNGIEARGRLVRWSLQGSSKDSEWGI